MIKCDVCKEPKKRGGARTCVDGHTLCRSCSKYSNWFQGVLKKLRITRRQSCPVCGKKWTETKFVLSK